MTRDECVAVLVGAGLLADTFDVSFVDSRRRWDGVLSDVYYNQGRYDASLGDNAAWSDALGIFRGNLKQSGTHITPWAAHAAVEAAANAAGVEAYLAEFIGSARAATVTADVVVETTAADVAGNYYMPTISDPANVSTSQLAKAVVLVWAGTYDGTVAASPAPTTTTVKVSTLADTAGELVGRRVVFGPESAGHAITSITNASGFCRITSSAGAFDEYQIDDYVQIGIGLATGNRCDVGDYNRGHKVTAVAGDGSYIDTDVPYSDDATGGVVNNCMGIQQGLVSAVDGTGSVLTFDPPLAEVPRVGAYVMAFGLDAGADRSLAEAADQLAAMPEGMRWVRINQPFSFNYANGLAAWYHDAGAFARGVLSWDRTYEVLGPVFSNLWSLLETLLTARGATLDGLYCDAEQHFAPTQLQTGLENQLVEEHEAGDVAVRFGFDPNELGSIGVGTDATVGVAPSAKHWKVWSSSAWSTFKADAYFGAHAGLVKAVFPDAEVVLFRDGSFCQWRANPVSPWRLQTNPLWPGQSSNLSNDITVAARQAATVGAKYLDLQNNVYWEHPYTGTDDAARYATIELGWQSMNGAVRSSSIAVIPTVYEFQNATFHPLIYSTQYMTEFLLHFFMHAGGRTLWLYNNPATDDSPTEDVLLELQSIAPQATRTPVALGDVRTGERYENAFVRSVFDAGGFWWWYFTSNPLASVTFAEDGDDVVVTSSGLYDAIDRLPNASLYTPSVSVGAGQWVRQSEPTIEAYIEFDLRIRGGAWVRPSRVDAPRIDRKSRIGSR